MLEFFRPNSALIPLIYIYIYIARMGYHFRQKIGEKIAENRQSSAQNTVLSCQAAMHVHHGQLSIMFV